MSIEKKCGLKVVSFDKSYFILTRGAENSIKIYLRSYSVRGLELLSEGSLKRDPSIDTTFGPTLFSLDDTYFRDTM